MPCGSTTYWPGENAVSDTTVVVASRAIESSIAPEFRPPGPAAVEPRELAQEARARPVRSTAAAGEGDRWAVERVLGVMRV